MFRRLFRWTIRLGVMTGIGYAVKKLSDEFKASSDAAAPSPYTPPARTDKVHAPADMANDAPIDAPPAEDPPVNVPPPDKPPITPPPRGNSSPSKKAPAAKKAPTKKAPPKPPTPAAPPADAPPEEPKGGS